MRVYTSLYRNDIKSSRWLVLFSLLIDQIRKAPMSATIKTPIIDRRRGRLSLGHILPLINPWYQSLAWHTQLTHWLVSGNTTSFYFIKVSELITQIRFPLSRVSHDQQVRLLRQKKEDSENLHSELWKWDCYCFDCNINFLRFLACNLNSVLHIHMFFISLFS